MKIFKNEYSGRLLERETLGEPDRAKLEFLHNPENKYYYLPYQKAQKMVEQAQLFDPTDPEPRFANDLHAAVAAKLELTDYRHLKFFTAVLTPLDFFHKVDGFFKYSPPGKEPVTVTLDVTENPAKDSCRADVLFNMHNKVFDPKEDKEAYLAQIDEFSQKIFEIMQKRLKGGEEK